MELRREPAARRLYLEWKLGLFVALGEGLFLRAEGSYRKLQKGGVN